MALGCVLQIGLGDKIIRSIEEEIKAELGKTGLKFHVMFHTVSISPKRPMLCLELLGPKRDARQARRLARKVFERANNLTAWATAGKIKTSNFLEKLEARTLQEVATRYLILENMGVKLESLDLDEETRKAIESRRRQLGRKMDRQPGRKGKKSLAELWPAVRLDQKLSAKARKNIEAYDRAAAKSRAGSSARRPLRRS